MVTMPAWIDMLNRKLLRDLSRMIMLRKIKPEEPNVHDLQHIIPALFDQYEILSSHEIIANLAFLPLTQRLFRKEKELVTHKGIGFHQFDKIGIRKLFEDILFFYLNIRLQRGSHRTYEWQAL